MEDMVGIATIAERLGLESGAVRRLIARQAGILHLELHRGKGDKLLLSREDAENLIANYQARRGPITNYQPRRERKAPDSPGTSSGVSSDDDSVEAKYDRYGFFYLIQLIPEVIPERVKIGFSDDPEKRLAAHKTSAPTAKLLRTWPCKRSWDYAAMDSITRTECKLVLNEVYEGDLEGFVARGDTFFGLMPDPDAERELSPHSPLFEASALAKGSGG